jgi:L-lactate permease
VIVGCSTVGLAGAEGDVLRRILLYGVAIVAAGGVLAAAISLLS